MVNQGAILALPYFDYIIEIQCYSYMFLAHSISKIKVKIWPRMEGALFNYELRMTNYELGLGESSWILVRVIIVR